MYYEEIKHFNEILEYLVNPPNYLLEEYIFDEERKNTLRQALETLKQGGRVVITGRSGCGKIA